MPKCTQCGVDKPQEEFRRYPQRKGYYKNCLSCQSLLGRYRYLVGKQDLNDAQREELEMMHTLYDKRRAKGLQVPGRDGKLLTHDHAPHGTKALLAEAMRLVDAQG